MDTRIDKLRAQQKQLVQRIKAIEAQQRSRQRRQETRRKILLGALLQHWMEQDADMRARVEAALPGFLTRKVDREVFALTEQDTAAASEDRHGRDTTAA